MDGATITAAWTLRVVQTARELGLDPTPMLADAGIAPALLDAPRGRVSFEEHARIVEKLARRLDDPGIGLDIGANASAADFGVVALLAESRPTLRDALAAVQRFNSVANQASRMDYRVERDLTFVRDGHLHDGRPAPPVLAEATLAFYTTMIRSSLGIEAPLFEVWLTHDRHRAWTPARLGTFGAPVRFRQPYNAVVLRSDLLDAPMRLARPGIAAHLELLASSFADQLPPTADLVARASACVRDGLQRGELLPIAVTARRLAASSRSLQRSLGQAGTSYSEVVDRVRRELTRELLADGSMKVDAIAARLCYSDARSFRRACLRWFGRTPGRHRHLPP